MWLYLIGVVFVLLGIVGVFAGGIYTLILVPIGLVVIASAAGYSIMGRGAHRAGGASTAGAAGGTTAGDPLPHTPHEGNGRTRTSPEALADARRVEQ